MKKRSSGVSSTGSVFEEDSSLMAHDILLMGHGAVQTLLGLSAWLTEDRAWTCDLEVGVLQGEVILDDTLATVNVSSLGGQEDYCGMLDSRLAVCDGMIYLINEKFDKDELDMVFEQISQAKDGRAFTMALALVGVDDSSSLFLKASEWAYEHYGIQVSCISREDDSASLTECLCTVAVNVQKTKRRLAELMSASQSTSSSPCTSSRTSGSSHSSPSSRRGSTSSTLSCIGLRWSRSSSSKRKSSQSSLSRNSSFASSRDEKRYSRYSSASTGSQYSVM